ncbi:hypothetical protein J5751_05120 [bacterium]|nr:hypothetical protein [bacterium]
MVSEYDTTRYIVDLIESKNIVKYLDAKMLKKNKVYYTFIEDKNIVVSCLYAKIVVEEYE